MIDITQTEVDSEMEDEMDDKSVLLFNARLDCLDTLLTGLGDGEWWMEYHGPVQGMLVRYTCHAGAVECMLQQNGNLDCLTFTTNEGEYSLDDWQNQESQGVVLATLPDLYRPTVALTLAVSHAWSDVTDVSSDDDES